MPAPANKPTDMVLATITGPTSLYKEKSVNSKRLAVLKKDDHIYVRKYDHDSWWCYCYHGTYGNCYALYYVEGKVHVSGSGIGAALESMRVPMSKRGDPTTGYQSKDQSKNELNIKASGMVQRDVNVRAAKTTTVAKVIGKLAKGTIVNMSEISTTSGWCKVTSAKCKDGTFQTGYVRYKTSAILYIKAMSTSSTLVSLGHINKLSTIVKTNGSGVNIENENGDPAEPDVNDSGLADVSTPIDAEINYTYIPEDRSMETDTTDYEAFSHAPVDRSDVKLSSYARGILGMPYQFSSLVDPKIEDSGYGRLFSLKIISNLPLLVITPGTPKYAPNYKNKTIKSNILTAASNMAKGIPNADVDLGKFIEDLTSKGEGKFYAFEEAQDKYYNYLNRAINELAIYLGIADKKIELSNGSMANIEGLNWKSFQNNVINDNTKGKGNSIGFYVDSESQISESFNNSTSQSQFSSSINQMNDLSREIQFLMGGAAGQEFNDLISNNFGDAFTQIENFTNKYLQVLPGLLTSRLKETFNTVKVGGQMIFPEIWNDSDYSRNVDINIKLRTPDGDNFSWFMNIGVPLMHLLTFTVPRKLGDNGIQSPFLIRAFYKGFFNVNMGIVSSLTISRGEKCKWTAQGLPTDIDVSLSIKDLYQSLSFAPESDFTRHTDELDFIANLCGINVNKPDALRSVALRLLEMKNALLNRVTFNHFMGLEKTYRSAIHSVLKFTGLVSRD